VQQGGILCMRKQAISNHLVEELAERVQHAG
jgi:hypothetical protein